MERIYVLPRQITRQLKLSIVRMQGPAARLRLGHRARVDQPVGGDAGGGTVAADLLKSSPYFNVENVMKPFEGVKVNPEKILLSAAIFATAAVILGFSYL